MKIIHSLEGKSWSGGQQQAFFLAQKMTELGHDVLLMCQQESVLETRAKSAGLKVKPHNYGSEMNPISIIKLFQTALEFKPDIVNVHRAWAHTQWLLVSLLLRFRGLIVTRRVLFKPDFNPLSLAKYRSPAVKSYIAVSKAVANRLAELGVPKHKIHVVYPATDTARFDPNNISIIDNSLKLHGKIILQVANFHPNKGHLLLLSAFKTIAQIIPDSLLVFVGLTTDCGKLKSLIDEHPFKERIYSLGYRNDIPHLMHRANVLVNPSFEEGFPGVIREALSMGLPVVASDIPSHREFAELFPIVFFSSGSVEKLAQAVIGTLNKPPTLEEKKALREKAIQEFSIDRMVEKTLAIYKKNIC